MRILLKCTQLKTSAIKDLLSSHNETIEHLKLSSLQFALGCSCLDILLACSLKRGSEAISGSEYRRSLRRSSHAAESASSTVSCLQICVVCLLRAPVEGQGECKSRAFSFFAVRPNPAAVGFHDHLADD